MFKRFIGFLILLSAFFFCGASSAFDMSNPYNLANEVAVKTINDIKANKDSISDQKVAEKIIKEDLMPYIDIRYAAYKVMGSYLKQSSEQERNDFTAVFENYMMKSLVNVLSQYTTQELITAPAKSVGADDKLVSVKFIVRQSGKQDIEVVLKMRKNNKTREWKAFDFIGENVSILDAKQSELAPIFQKDGVLGAINALKNADVKSGKKYE